MAEYKFILNSEEVEHPIGWENLSLVYSDDGKGMFKSLDDTFIFCGRGYEIINNSIQTSPCEKLKLEIQYNSGSGFIPLIHLYLSLLEIQIDCNRCQATIPGSSLGLADFVENAGDKIIFPATDSYEVFETETGIEFSGYHNFSSVSELLSRMVANISAGAYQYYSEFFIKSFRKNRWRLDVSGGLNGTAVIKVDGPFGKRRATVNGTLLSPEEFGRFICNALQYYGDTYPGYDQLITDPVSYCYYEALGFINPNVVWIESWWPVSVTFEVNGVEIAPTEYQPWQYGGREMVISGLGLSETYQEIEPIKLINTVSELFNLKYELNENGQIRIDEKDLFYDFSDPLFVETSDTVNKTFSKEWRKNRFDTSHEFGLSPSVDDTEPGRSKTLPVVSAKHIGVSNIYDNGTWEKIRFGDERFDSLDYYSPSSYAYSPKHSHKAGFRFSILVKGVGNAVVTAQVRDNSKTVAEGYAIEEYDITQSGTPWVTARVLVFELEADVEPGFDYTIFAKTDSLSLPMTIYTDEVYTQLSISIIGIANNCYGQIGNDESTWKQLSLTSCAGSVERKPDNAFYGGLGYAFDQKKYGLNDYANTHFFADYDNITKGLLRFVKGVFFARNNTCLPASGGGRNEGKNVLETIVAELNFYNIPIQPSFILNNWVKDMPYDLTSRPFSYADVVVSGSNYSFRDIQFELNSPLEGNENEGFLYETEVALSPSEYKKILTDKTLSFNVCGETKIFRLIYASFSLQTGRTSIVCSSK